ncbi:uncharacterized protein [Euphorbia lathyris]|uniref:uncharacterized protein n=1 Tax=Euphorbia lathyris TaxID=212925 RepID=UPI0033142BC5
MNINYLDDSDDDSSMDNLSLIATRGVCQIMQNNNRLLELCMDSASSQSTPGGSVPGHRVIYRNREVANRQLHMDYFNEEPVFNEEYFFHRFRMCRSLFLRIIIVVKDHDGYFQQRRDATGRLGLSMMQKATAVFRILAYGVPADATDEYIKIGESTANESVKRSYRVIVEIFSDQYLREPNANDIARLLHIGEQRGFPANGIAPLANYVIESKKYNMGYYLADGIYPKWSTLVQTIREPRDQKKMYFAMKQEACRKDVERAFGVLQSRFAIVAGPVRYWCKQVLHDIMKTCIILHNMIIEDERDLSAPVMDSVVAPTPTVENVHDEEAYFRNFLQ